MMNDTFLRACRGEPTDYTPIWMMRQAGRFLPEYQKVLARHDFLTACRTPEIAAEITMQPVDVLGVDAAIFYSDITTTVVPMGIELHYEKGKGPSYPNPIRTRADVDNLRVPDDPADGLAFVYEAQKICARELESKVPLIGFAGAPFTVSAYMVEGRGTNSFVEFRKLAFSQPEIYSILMDKVARHTANYLKAQAAAGANALMLFDSHAGLLGPGDYAEMNLPYVKQIIADIKSAGVPVIYLPFAQHNSLGSIQDCGADVIALDYGFRLDDAIEELGQHVSVQGNVEPHALFLPRDKIEQRVTATLKAGKGARGHIFNLGHGVPQHAPVDNVKAMIDMVHEKTQAKAA